MYWQNNNRAHEKKIKFHFELDIVFTVTKVKIFGMRCSNKITMSVQCNHVYGIAKRNVNKSKAKES